MLRLIYREDRKCAGLAWAGRGLRLRTEALRGVGEDDERRG